MRRMTCMIAATGTGGTRLQVVDTHTFRHFIPTGCRLLNPSSPESPQPFNRCRPGERMALLLQGLSSGQVECLRISASLDCLRTWSKISAREAASRPFSITDPPADTAVENGTASVAIRAAHPSQHPRPPQAEPSHRHPAAAPHRSSAVPPGRTRHTRRVRTSRLLAALVECSRGWKPRLAGPIQPPQLRRSGIASNGTATQAATPGHRKAGACSTTPANTAQGSLRAQHRTLEQPRRAPVQIQEAQEGPHQGRSRTLRSWIAAYGEAHGRKQPAHEAIEAIH